jgi:hypothetical protein
MELATLCNIHFCLQLQKYPLMNGFGTRFLITSRSTMKRIFDLPLRMERLYQHRQENRRASDKLCGYFCQMLGQNYTETNSDIRINYNSKYLSGGETLSREITAENALIESISTRNGTGFVTISYGVMDRNRIMQMQVVTLVIGNNTRIINQFGNRTNFRVLNVGMVVNARFSSNMTGSNPPQARASNIVIVKESNSSLIEEGRVINVGQNSGFGYILTGNPNDPNRQMQYNISNTTKLRDRRGNRITLSAIRPGQTVRIERQSFQTMSIPPQTSALSVQIIAH